MEMDVILIFLSLVQNVWSEHWASGRASHRQLASCHSSWPYTAPFVLNLVLLMSGASALQHHVFLHVCSSWCSSDPCANATGPLNSSCFLAHIIPSIPLKLDKECCVRMRASAGTWSYYSGSHTWFSYWFSYHSVFQTMQVLKQIFRVQDVVKCVSHWIEFFSSPHLQCPFVTWTIHLKWKDL